MSGSPGCGCFLCGVSGLWSLTRRSRVLRNSFRLPCSNSEESDDDVLSVGAVRPLPNAAPLGGAGMVDIHQQHADVKNDVFLMGAWGPMNQPGTCCARLDDFEWVVPPYEPDMVLPGRDVDIGTTDVGRDVRVLPEMFPVVAEETAVVPKSWPVVVEMEPQVGCESDLLLSEREVVDIADIRWDIRYLPDVFPVSG